MEPRSTSDGRRPLSLELTAYAKGQVAAASVAGSSPTTSSSSRMVARHSMNATAARCAAHVTRERLQRREPRDMRKPLEQMRKALEGWGGQKSRAFGGRRPRRVTFPHYFFGRSKHRPRGQLSAEKLESAVGDFFERIQNLEKQPRAHMLALPVDARCVASTSRPCGAGAQAEIGPPERGPLARDRP